MKPGSLVIAIFATHAMIAAPAAAQAVIHEPFADANFDDAEPDTSLGANAGGTGLTGNWTVSNADFQKAANLTYGSLATSGSSINTSTVSGAGWSNAEVGVDITPAYTALLADGGEMWFSIVYRPSLNGTIVSRFAMALTDVGIGTNGDLDAGGTGIGFGHALNGVLYSKVWTTNDWAPSNNLQAAPDNFVSGETTLVADTTYLIVGRVQWGADGSSNDIVTLYLPGTDLTLGEPVAVSQGIVNQSGFDAIGISNLQNSSVTFDEIRIGATSADVLVIGEESAGDFSVVITPNAVTPGNYDFTWQSQSGKTYDLVSATDLSTPPATWSVWNGQSDIAATPPSNALTDIPGGGDARRFFAIIEKDAPPAE